MVIEATDLYHKMREACTTVVKNHGISPEWFCWAMLISLVQVRNGAILTECGAVKHNLSEKICRGNTEYPKNISKKSYANPDNKSPPV